MIQLLHPNELTSGFHHDIRKVLFHVLFFSLTSRNYDGLSWYLAEYGNVMGPMVLLKTAVRHGRKKKT